MTHFRIFILSFLTLGFLSCSAQKVTSDMGRKPAEPLKLSLTPELLWELNRVSPIGLSSDNEFVIYQVSKPNVEENNFSTKYYKVPIKGGDPSEIASPKGMTKDTKISPDGSHRIMHKAVKINNVNGSDYYPDLKKSTAQIYNELDYRHWDKWNDGTFNHVFFGRVDAPESEFKDILLDEPYYCPQEPFGGSEDYVWTPDGKAIIYVSKKLAGTAYATSTNTDLYRYDIATGNTTNLTANNKGYDTHPTFSVNGDMAYLSMATDGYEADKNDIKVLSNGITTNLTAHWDETVMSYKWSNDGRDLYFIAATNGTLQLFKVDFPGRTKKMPLVQQLTEGDWDVNSIIGQSGDLLIVTRGSIQRAPEIYSYNVKTKEWRQLSDANDNYYKNIAEVRTERRFIKTTDGKEMLAWVIYPPGFSPAKKYPTLLYCQGGPQSALTQFYSFRWNFSIMASQGYIVIAPNRRGMPGHGVEWNRQISKDYGGQNMQDYLSAIDDIAKEDYVDKDRLGAIGASYGGYSIYYLAGIHNKRFKSFIAHDGIFNTQSMYGTTEEMFFVNYDMGGPYWDPSNKKAYTDFNPITRVAQWDTPILIIQGGRDYRVPPGQALEAFNAAQLRGIKSRLLYLPDENHWVLKPQNGLVWQRQFFAWLEETL